MPAGPSLLPHEAAAIKADNEARTGDFPPMDSDPFDLPPADEPPAEPPPPANPKIAAIEALAVRKGYDLFALPQPLDEYSDRAIETFRKKLEALPDAPQTFEDDIPF